MSLKRATPVEIIDGTSFRLRTDAIIVLDGVETPDMTTPEGQKAKEKLGWQPETSFEDIVKIMVDADMKMIWYYV